MPARKANEAQFLFYCGNLKPQTFQVAEFTGRDAISSPYDFSLTLISPANDIQYDDVINKQATLYIYRDGEYFPYSGIVSEFHFIDSNVDFSTYHIRLVPRFWLMILNEQTRIFQKMSISDIVKKVFEDAGMGSYYKFDLTGTYPQRDYVVQYQESDFNFLSRLLESAGIWYFFTEQPRIAEEIDGAGGETMIISDNPKSFENIPGESAIIFRPQSGLAEQMDHEDKESVSKLSYERRVVPKEVLLKNYNYRTPEVDVSARATVQKGDVGTVYRYGGSFRNTDEARKAAEVVAGQLGCEQIRAAGRSNCRGLRAGKRFAIKEHGRSDCNDTYLVRSVVHMGAHNADKGTTGICSYTNEFQAIPSALIDSFRPAPKAIIPRISGVITAPIEAQGAGYAALDDMGRYKVRMPFDISDSKNYEASKYIRLAQPYSGAGYGIHFPSHEGAEMVLACIDGDPEKPLGVGTVPNANTVSPVVSSNKAQGIIRSAGGNELLFDDTDGKQKVRITTKAKNVAEFDDENKRLVIQTTDGNMLTLDDKNEKTEWMAKDHVITMSYKGGEEGITVSTAGGNVVKIDDKNKKLTIQTNGGHIIEMDDNGKKITLADGNGKSTVTLDGGKGIVLDTKGKVSIHAAQDIEIKGANIKINASSGNLEAKAMSDVNLTGMNISEKATMDLKIEGMNINAKARMNAKVEGGVGVEVKSGVQTKVSGTMAEVSGSAMTTVKGGVVMIN
mgnify:CR=1 FL=1